MAWFYLDPHDKLYLPISLWEGDIGRIGSPLKLGFLLNWGFLIANFVAKIKAGLQKHDSFYAWGVAGWNT